MRDGVRWRNTRVQIIQAHLHGDMLGGREDFSVWWLRVNMAIYIAMLTCQYFAYFPFVAIYAYFLWSSGVIMSDNVLITKWVGESLTVICDPDERMDKSSHGRTRSTFKRDLFLHQLRFLVMDWTAHCTVIWLGLGLVWQYCIIVGSVYRTAENYYVMKADAQGALNLASQYQYQYITINSSVLKGI